jgi:hypothetical protein
MNHSNRVTRGSPSTNRPGRAFAVLPALISVLGLLAGTASALILTGRGHDPVQDAGWPQGALALANLKSRVGWWEGPPFGGGQWQFLYRGDTAVFAEALKSFASVRAPALDLVIHDGPEENTFLKDEKKPPSDARVDWTFTVWNPARWHHLFNNPKSVFSADHPSFRQPVDPPRLDVYVGGGGVDWTKVALPTGLRVRDERASAAGITPTGGAVVRAEVYDMATGKPVIGARMIIASMARGGQDPEKDYQRVAEGVSDDSGRVVVERIPVGTHRVSVMAGGYAPRVLGYDRYGERTFKQFQVELAEMASVRGMATDLNGQPLPGVTVNASSTMAIDGRGYSGPDMRQAVTDATGRFTLSGLPAGYTQIRAHAPGYYFGDIFTIHDVPSTNVVLRLTGAGIISVRIFDKNGQAISRFQGSELHVSVEPKGGSRIGSWGGGARVQDDGTYEFKDLPPGEYRISSRPNPVSSNRQNAPEQIIQVKPGMKTEVKIVYEDVAVGKTGGSKR